MNIKLQTAISDHMNCNLDELKLLSKEQAYGELKQMEFCQGLIEALEQEFKEEFSNHEFYRWSLLKEDLHLAWGTENPIAIQIDPGCEVICIWGYEFGNWTKEDNPVANLVNLIKEDKT